MIRALYTAASGMSAQQTNLDTIANNLANSATTGFHQRQVQFEDMIYQNSSLRLRADATDSFSWSASRSRNQIGSQRSDHDAGRLQPDEWPARLGDSRRWLLPDIPARRNHRIHQSWQLPSEQSGNARHLGWRYCAAAISIPSNATNITISQYGVVSATLPGQTNAAQLGTFQLATFANPEA